MKWLGKPEKTNNCLYSRGGTEKCWKYDTGTNGPSSDHVPTIILQSYLNSGFHFGSYFKPLETPQASLFVKIQKDPNLNTKQ